MEDLYQRMNEKTTGNNTLAERLPNGRPSLVLDVM